MGDGGVEILVAGNLAYSWVYTIASQNLHKLHLLSPAAYFSQLLGAVSSESSRTSSQWRLKKLSKHPVSLDVFICNDFGASNDKDGRRAWQWAVRRGTKREEMGEEMGGEDLPSLNIPSLCLYRHQIHGPRSVAAGFSLKDFGVITVQILDTWTSSVMLGKGFVLTSETQLCHLRSGTTTSERNCEN